MNAATATTTPISHGLNFGRHGEKGTGAGASIVCGAPADSALRLSGVAAITLYAEPAVVATSPHEYSAQGEPNQPFTTRYQIRRRMVGARLGQCSSRFSRSLESPRFGKSVERG